MALFAMTAWVLSGTLLAQTPPPDVQGGNPAPQNSATPQAASTPAPTVPPQTNATPPPASQTPAPSRQHVEIDKGTQTLSAYDGKKLVLRAHVSTGRTGKHTPSRTFTVNEKERMHHSRLYHDAPMPFSVHLEGNYFIHGFTSVPSHPSSHGCIRLPMTGDNPARKFYNWVQTGTPVHIFGQWKR